MKITKIVIVEIFFRKWNWISPRYVFVENVPWINFTGRYYIQKIEDCDECYFLEAEVKLPFGYKKKIHINEKHISFVEYTFFEKID